MLFISDYWNHEHFVTDSVKEASKKMAAGPCSVEQVREAVVNRMLDLGIHGSPLIQLLKTRALARPGSCFLFTFNFYYYDTNTVSLVEEADALKVIVSELEDAAKQELGSGFMIYLSIHLPLTLIFSAHIDQVAQQDGKPEDKSMLSDFQRWKLAQTGGKGSGFDYIISFDRLYISYSP